MALIVDYVTSLEQKARSLEQQAFHLEEHGKPQDAAALKNPARKLWRKAESARRRRCHPHRKGQRTA
jgi:hypothetical protein